jgi:hypothetical protein
LTVASDTAVLGFACRRSEVYVSLGGLVHARPDQPAHGLARERLEAAQNQSEARALMFARQLQSAGTNGRER